MSIRATAWIAVLAGAVSVGLMLRAGQGNNSRLLLGLIALWVLSPFVALVCARAVSKRWPVPMPFIALGSVAIYLFNAVKPLSSKAAFVFVAVPPASWLLGSIILMVSAFRSRR